MIEAEDIFLGVATRDVNLCAKPGEGLNYWGYVCCAAKAFSPRDETSFNYGEMCAINDVVGVLLEFDRDQAQLSFYRNKVLFYPHSAEKSGIGVQWYSGGGLLSDRHALL
jgi:hypothetical protein